MAQRQPEVGTRVVLTAMRVLEAVWTCSRLGVLTAAWTTGIPRRASAQRCLVSLREAGWLAAAEGDSTAGS